VICLARSPRSPLETQAYTRMQQIGRKANNTLITTYRTVGPLTIMHRLRPLRLRHRGLILLPKATGLLSTFMFVLRAMMLLRSNTSI